MTRRSIIILSALLALLLAALSIGVTLYISWINAEKNELSRLGQYAERVSVRALKSFHEASNILDQLQKSSTRPCSLEHIALMRKLNSSSLVSEEIGYFENETLKCNSWGMVNEKVFLAPADLTLKTGIEIRIGVIPLFPTNQPVIALSHNNYNVLMNSARFTDIITEPEIKIILTLNNGKMVSGLNDPNPNLIPQVLDGKTSFKNELVYVSKKPNVIVIVSEAKQYVMLRWYKEIKTLAPLGILLTLSFVGMIIWLSRRRLSPLGVLKTAIATHAFSVHYQPLIELSTGKCIGAEALIRWQQPDGTWQRPDIFITLAEDNNLIQPITDQMIGIVICELKNLLNTHQDLHISINIAAIDFETGRILSVLSHALQGTGIHPQQIWLEATERSFMNKDHVMATLKQSRERGHPIVIDDFGTGYSSLSYLQNMPLDTIKIDKSFISAVGKGSATSQVVHHIIRMAKQLKLKIVAEGVETQEQIDFLRTHDVDYIQGWFYAKAMPLNEFIEFYKRNH